MYVDAAEAPRRPVWSADLATHDEVLLPSMGRGVVRAFIGKSLESVELLVGSRKRLPSSPLPHRYVAGVPGVGLSQVAASHEIG